MVEALQRCSDAEPVIRDLKISAVVAFDFRIDHGGHQFAAWPGSRRGKDGLFFGRFRLWHIDRFRLAFLKSKDLLPGLLRQLRGQ